MNITNGKRTFMVAAENGALPHGKVGGVGDVIRDLPLAMAGLGWQPTVITPAYGMFDKLPGAEELMSLGVDFGGNTQHVSVITVPGPEIRVQHIAFEHGMFSPQGPGEIYCDDGSARPFATDATKFAFFCAAVAAYINGLKQLPDVIHLHDWHTALYCVLRAFDQRYQRLQKVRTVCTVHNLAVQGIRPLDGDDSSLRHWYPDLLYKESAVIDHRYTDCINPLASAIRLADKVNTVSPTYAREILQESDPEHGFIGGEGLEADLGLVASDGDLLGILNGCEYPEQKKSPPDWRLLLERIGDELKNWRSNDILRRQIHDQALERLRVLPSHRPANLLTSVGRLTAQKVQLFLTPVGSNKTALETILNDLGADDVLIMLGSGDAKLEQRLTEIARDNPRLLFLCGYSESVGDTLYQAGDLFLMPSSFEPCGISQMIAMRAGQPCVVHAVGGLKDTVRHGYDGFSFDGSDPVTQAKNFTQTVRQALRLKAEDHDRWLNIREQAAAARFTWRSAAEQYIAKIYE